MSIDLSLTLCLDCKKGPLSHDEAEDQVVCSACAATYDVYKDVPALVRYQPNEALSLIEILGQIGTTAPPPSLQSYALWPTVLKEYHEAEDRAAYLDTKVGGIRDYLPHRHRQYAVLRDMLETIDLRGKTVLNVGAGSGFDTAVLQSLGAKVTSAEFSPHLCARSAPATPDSDWLAVSGHALPFADESFDITIAQATLHHMLHIPACMSEMLRVLKVGGDMISVADSFCGNHQDEDFGCKHFNNDPAVLSGVNENIPRMAEFSETPVAYADYLDVRMLTTMVYGYPDEGKRVNIDTHRWWTLQDLPVLETLAGGISWHLHKNKPTPIEPPHLEPEVIRPNALLAEDQDKAGAMAILAAKLPQEYVNLPFRP